jgi:hypothetical protein
MALHTIIASLGDMPGADAPHCHAPMTAAEAARQLLEMHPNAERITMEEAETLVFELGEEASNGGHRSYQIGGEPGGNIGGPGTWISTGKGKDRPMLGISATMPLLYPQDAMPVDETLLGRLEDDLRMRVSGLGADPSCVRLVERTPSAFGDGDTIAFATPATPIGTDVFHGHFSHNRAPFSMRGQEILDAAARLIVAHHRHADEIRRRLEEMAALVRRRFDPLGATVGETMLVSVHADDAGLTRVEAATPVTILGHAFEPFDVLVRTNSPHVLPKGEFDGLREHSRTQRRRLKLLAGRRPADAYTVCAITARHYATLEGEEARAKAVAVRAAADGRVDEGQRHAGGIEYVDGMLVDVMRIAEGVTFRNRTLMVQDAVVPQTIMQAIVGRPATDVVDDPRLADLRIVSGRRDKKGRTVFVVDGLKPVPLAPVLERLSLG